jgi:hypothetical protein
MEVCRILEVSADQAIAETGRESLSTTILRSMEEMAFICRSRSNERTGFKEKPLQVPFKIMLLIKYMLKFGNPVACNLSGGE